MNHFIRSKKKLLWRTITRSIWPVIVAVGVLLGVGHATPAIAQSSRAQQVRAVRSQLMADNPGLRMMKTGDRITRLYGKSFGSGRSVEAVAEHFRQNQAMAFGVEPRNLKRGGRAYKGRFTQPVMYDHRTGKYKFTLVYYTQHKGDVPVFRSDLRLLIRNEDNKLVWANSSLRDLGKFRVSAADARIDATAVAMEYADPDFVDPDFVRDARTVVWAGYGEQSDDPRLAVAFIAGDDGFDGQEWMYVVDASTGEQLLKIDMIVYTSVSGNVSGMSTDGHGSSACDTATISRPLAWSHVEIIDGNDTTIVVTDALTGDFSLSGLGTDSVDVQAFIEGKWFKVYNERGSDASLPTRLLPTDSIDFVFNSVDSQLVRSQVDAYIAANRVRDMVLECSPDFPGLDLQPMRIHVNTDYLCPNAYYRYSDTSLNFCDSMAGPPLGDYGNFAFSQVVYHEYGHHLVAQSVAQGKQGEYGEGIGDCLAAMISSEYMFAEGYRGPPSCHLYLRPNWNEMQYPCESGLWHTCGTILSGCVWDTKLELGGFEADSANSILFDLVVNSILLHSDFTIDPRITVDFLTLDDDDGDLSNGTPHSDAIEEGFAQHNMVLPTYQTFWVDGVSGSDSTGVGSEVNPFATIQKGIDTAAIWGDTLLVKPATYTETIDFGGKGLVVRSTNGPASTIIQAGAADDTLVTFETYENYGTVLDGFRVDGGAVGVLIRTTGPIIRNNILTGQSFAGVYVFNEGLYARIREPLIENNTILYGDGAGIICGTTNVLPPYTTMYVRNNIIAYNEYGLKGIWMDTLGYFYSTNPVNSYNCVYGNDSANYDPAFTEGTGSISNLDPLLDASDSVSLTAASPCIDAGDPDTLFNDANGTRSDMGAIPFPYLRYWGTLSENTTFDEKVYVMGDLTIPLGKTLTIETSDVEIVPFTDFDTSGMDDSKVELRVYGNLRLEGSPSERIELGPDDGEGDSSWSGVMALTFGRIYADNAYIKNAYLGMRLEGYLTDTVINSRFENCFMYGLLTYSDKAYIYQNTFAITRAITTGYGIYAFAADGPSVISDCYFENPMRPIRLYNSDLTVEDCLFKEYDYHYQGSGGYPAISAYYADGSIDNCTFNNYAQGVSVETNTDISIDGCEFKSDSTRNDKPFMFIAIQGSPNSSSCEIRNTCFKPSEQYHVSTDSTSFDLGVVPDSGLNTFHVQNVYDLGPPKCTHDSKPDYAINNNSGSTVEAEGNWWDNQAHAYWIPGTVDITPSLSSPVQGCSFFTTRCDPPKVVAEEPEVTELLPVRFAVRQNYPNPFNPVTVISFDLPKRADVKLSIFNVLGQRVATLVNRVMDPGVYEIEWDGRDEFGSSVSTGVYLYRLTAGEFVESKKMMLIK